MDDHRSDFADNSREIREEVKKWPFFTQPNRIMLELFFFKNNSLILKTYLTSFRCLFLYCLTSLFRKNQSETARNGEKIIPWSHFLHLSSIKVIVFMLKQGTI